MGIPRAQLERWGIIIPPAGGKRGNKYGVSAAVDRTVDGIVFDSKKEAKYYSDLKLKVKAGVVRYFLMQVPFRLPGGVVYRADFVVFYSDRPEEIIDVKGVKTQVYQIKKRQVEQLYPIKITEV